MKGVAEPMSRWGENLGAPEVCHVSGFIRAGFEPCRAFGIPMTPAPTTLQRFSALKDLKTLCVLYSGSPLGDPSQVGERYCRSWFPFSSSTMAPVVFNQRIVVFLHIRSNQSNPFAMP